MLDAALIDRFAAIVGPSGVITSPEAIAPHLEEWRGLWRGQSRLVLKPGTVAEVSAILALATESRTAIVPQGGNTGLVGGQIPDQTGDEVILSLSRMNRIRALDTAARVMTAEAGCILADIQSAAASAGLLFPLALASEGSCQIGGNLSANAGGIGALAYGVARDLCLGLEVVLPDGTVVNGLRSLKKDNRGYDLKNLFIGAEGTLGIITAASLKLFPAPKGQALAWIGLASPEAALRLFLDLSDRFGPDLTAFELCGRTPMAFTFRHFPQARPPLDGDHEWHVLCEVSSRVSDADARDNLSSALEAALGPALVEDAAIAQSDGQARAFRAIREWMSDAQKPEGGSIKHDISLPLAEIPAFIAAAATRVEAVAPGARVVCFGHMGDGNLHYNVSQPVGADKAAFLARWEEISNAVHALVAAHGGSYSAEHGIGRLKRDLLARTHDAGALGLMRALKATIDPLGIMNPGKVL